MRRGLKKDLQRKPRGAKIRRGFRLKKVWGKRGEQQ